MEQKQQASIYQQIDAFQVDQVARFNNFVSSVKNVIADAERHIAELSAKLEDATKTSSDEPTEASSDKPSGRRSKKQ